MRLFSQWWWRGLSRETEVPIRSCVHFCGFRYGCGDCNPYENYLQALAGGEPVAAARARFVDFLQHYRPEDFGAALGVELERVYPLWLYPWTRRPPEPGWRERQEQCPDILTHFTRSGIAWARITEEFGWLEQSLASIRQHGFQPGRFRSPIRARQLVRDGGSRAWLLLDGNHRVAALSALGVEKVRLRYLPVATVRESGVEKWMQVRCRVYSVADARRVLRAYFTGNARPRTTDTPAPLTGVSP